MINQQSRRVQLLVFQMLLVLCASAGDTWAHCASTRVILYWQGNQRYAHLYKSSYLPNATAPYWVTSHGIRGSIANKREGTIPATGRGSGHTWSESNLETWQNNCKLIFPTGAVARQLLTHSSYFGDFMVSFEQLILIRETQATSGRMMEIIWDNSWLLL